MGEVASVKKTEGQRRVYIAAAAAAAGKRKKKDVYNKLDRNAWNQQGRQAHKTNQDVTFGQAGLRKTDYSNTGRRRLPSKKKESNPLAAAAAAIGKSKKNGVYDKIDPKAWNQQGRQAHKTN